jgi:uncharacterized membrane protein YjjB (DUF3815 family)
MGLMDNVQQWFVGVAVKKAVIKACVAAAAYFASTGVLKKYGISIDWNVFQAAAISGAAGAIEFARNWLKVNKGLSWL